MAALALLLPASAQASTSVGFDPDFVTSGGSTPCPSGCTLVQQQVAGLDQAVPADGVVTALRVKGTSGTARLRRVVQDTPGRGTGGAATAPVTLTGLTQEAAVALPVRAGDTLGLELSRGARLAADDSSLPGDQMFWWSPALAEGETRILNVELRARLAYQAVIEPDRDGDGRGDETQDACVFCDPGPSPDPGPPAPQPQPNPEPAPPAPKPQPKSTPTDPYAAVRKTGPKVTFASTMQRRGRKITLTVTNPHAFTVKGKVAVRSGKKTVGTTRATLTAGATKKLSVVVKGGARAARRLAVAGTFRAPVGKAATTRATVKLGKVAKPKPQGGDAPAFDGTYRGAGGGDAGWTMVVQGGVVTSFDGTLTLACTKGGTEQAHPVAMIGDDPKPTVAPDGTFAWEATTGYGLTKLKLTGKIAGDQATGNVAVEYRPPRSGESPVTGLPRMEFDYCYAGRDYALSR